MLTLRVHFETISVCCGAQIKKPPLVQLVKKTQPKPKCEIPFCGYWLVMPIISILQMTLLVLLENRAREIAKMLERAQLQCLTQQVAFFSKTSPTILNSNCVIFQRQPAKRKVFLTSSIQFIFEHLSKRLICFALLFIEDRNNKGDRLWYIVSHIF